MARKTITVDDDNEMIDVTPQQIEGIVADDVSKIRETDAALENDINAEMGGDENDVSYKISVFRIPDTGKDMPYLFSIPGENVAGIRERLMAEYGNGHYSIQVWTIRPRVGARIKAKYRVKIEMPKNAQPAPQVNSASDAVAQAVLQQGKMLEAVLSKIMTAPPPPPPPAQDMVALFGGMAAMAKAMREIAGPPATAAAPINPFDMLQSVVSLVKDANSEGREKGLFDMVGDFLNSEVMKTVVQNLTPQNPQPQPQRAIAGPQPGAAQIPQPPAPNGSPPAATATDPGEKALRDLLSLFLAAAKKKSDPGLYADLIEDAIGAPMLAQLLALPDPVGALAAYEPQIATHREWFASVLNLLTDSDEEQTRASAPNSPAMGSDAVGSPAPAASADGPA